MGPKKKKETEEERIAREEAERKQAELEAKRAAEAEAKRLAEEARIAAERVEFRTIELERLNNENVILLDKIKGRIMQRNAEDAAENSNLEWLKYKDPTGETDVTDLRDLNTFVTLTSEENANELSECLEIVRKIENVSLSVESTWSDAVANKNFNIQTQSKINLETFSKMIMDKIDISTAHLLRFVDNQINDRYEINIEELAKDVQIGMWASFSDMRPIRKSVQFEKMGIQLDIPKQILVQDARFVHRIIKIPIDSISIGAYEQSSLDSINVNNNDNASSKASANDIDADSPNAINNNPTGGISKLSFMNKFVIGDIFFHDIIFPPKSAFNLRAKKWIIRESSEECKNVKRSTYPSSVACRLFIKIPDDIIMSDDVRMCVWDAEKCEWSEEGINDFQYSEANRIVQFSITVVGMIALVKDRCADMPYKRWSLTAMRSDSNNISSSSSSSNSNASAAAGTLASAASTSSATSADNSLFSSSNNIDLNYEKQARLQIQTQKHDVVIDIIGSLCKLVRPNIKALSSLIGIEMSPGKLIYKLQKRGINLLPTQYDLSNVEECVSKNVELELNIVEQMARCASSIDFQSSIWSQQLLKSQIGLLARETSAYTGAVETFDFECILIEEDQVSESYRHAPNVGSSPGPKYLLVIGNDYGDKKGFSHAARPQEVTHLELLSSLNSRLTNEAKDRAERCNERFISTVETLLKLTRPLSLS